jgi:hypothetical protein
MLRILLSAALMLATVGGAWAQVSVRGYYRSNGTYVAPHYRSAPDSSYNNNWSVQPNVNPYTGQMGTRSPTYNDRPPSSGYGLGSGGGLYGGSGSGLYR